MEKVAVVIVAGGNGSRMGVGIKKQYIKLQDKEVLAHTIEVFEKSDLIDQIIVVVGRDDINYVERDICEKYGYTKVTKVVEGGRERQDSVYNGLLNIEDEVMYVMVHDGARPFVTEEIIKRGLETAKTKGGTIIAVPVKDTIKECTLEDGRVENTPIRQKLWSVQTPQIFKYDLLRSAYNYVRANNMQITDDSMAVEAIGETVYITEGTYTNIKITTPEDIMLAEAFLKK